jgi:hypothetical protein
MTEFRTAGAVAGLIGMSLSAFSRGVPLRAHSAVTVGK